MATRILTGSTGTYKSLCGFRVTQDTCSSLDYVVGRFQGGCEDVRIEKCYITWINLKTKDFQGT